MYLKYSDRERMVNGEKEMLNFEWRMAKKGVRDTAFPRQCKNIKGGF